MAKTTTKKTSVELQGTKTAVVSSPTLQGAKYAQTFNNQRVVTKPTYTTSTKTPYRVTGAGTFSPTNDWSGADAVKIIYKDDPANTATNRNASGQVVDAKAKPTVSLSPADIIKYGAKGAQDIVSGRNLKTVLTSQATQSNTPASSLDLTPRANATVATYDNPLVTTGTPTSGLDFNSLADSEKYRQIALKQADQEALTKDEKLWLIDQYSPYNTSASDGVKSAYDASIAATQGQAKTLEEQKAATAAQQEIDRKSLLDKQEDVYRGQVNAQELRAQQAGERESQAVQDALSFSGFGRSTYNADKQALIAQNTNDSIKAYNDAKDLAMERYKQELEGADQTELDNIQARIDDLNTQADQMTIDSAIKVAELNAENAVPFADALDNIAKLFPTSTQNKIDAETSKLLGYVADSYGNAIGADAEGNPVPLPIEEDAIKYSTYTDADTGQTYFYDPADPLGTMMAAPNGGVQSFTSPDGTIESSPTSYSGGVVDITSSANLTEAQKKWAANCAEFVRTFVPNMPKGNYSVADRKKSIATAKAGGYGSDNMDTVQVGDAVLTTEGNVGHSFMVAEVDGDDLIILEANYKPGQITYGRRISKDDAKILGYVRPTNGAPSVVNYVPSKQEGNNIAISDAVGGNVTITASDEAKFKKFAETGVYPSFTGRTDYIKDQAQKDFDAKYDYWATTNTEATKGKQLTGPLLTELSDATSAMKSLMGISSTIDSGVTNPFWGSVAQIWGIGKLWGKKQVAISDLMSVAQVVGRYLEGGKLAEGDSGRYAKMLPNITDTDDVAKTKLKHIYQLVVDRNEQNIQTLKASGYDTTGLETVRDQLQQLDIGGSISEIKAVSGDELAAYAKENGIDISEAQVLLQNAGYYIQQ